MSTPGKRYPPRPKPADAVDNRLICQALCRGPLATTVTAVAGSAARDGRAHIAVRFGRVLLYLEDRAALDALSGAVGRAEEVADATFGPRDDEFHRAEQRARTRFERTSKLPV